MKNNNLKIASFYLLLILFASCGDSDTGEEIVETQDIPTVIEYDEENSIIKNTLSIDWDNSTYSNNTINLNSGDYNELSLSDNKFFTFFSRDSNNNTIFKMTVGKNSGSDYMEEGVLYDLSENENYKNITIDFYGADTNGFDLTFSANHNKNTASNTNGIGTFKILNLTESDDDNNMNDIIEIEFNNVNVYYSTNVYLTFSGIIKANIK